jgi:arabinogalactan oligomer / maltooligosaccharide transport system permease protein
MSATTSTLTIPSPRRGQLTPRQTAQTTTAGTIVRHSVALFMVVFALFPVMAVVTSAFSGTNDLNSIVPSTFDLKNFRTLFTDDTVLYTTWARNTIIVCTSNGILNVLIGALGAYAFSRLRFKGRRAGLLTLLMIQIFPSFLSLTAIYYIMTQITEVAPFIGKNTLFGLILVYTGGALGVNSWLIKGFFDTIPKELDESAMIDGASHAQIFFKIILPLAVPALAVVFTLSFIGLLNEFILAATLNTDPEKQTLAVGLYNFIGTDFGQKWGPFAAGALIAAIPVVAIVLSMQRYIVSGLVAGSVKG